MCEAYTEIVSKPLPEEEAYCTRMWLVTIENKQGRSSLRWFWEGYIREAFSKIHGWITDLPEYSLSEAKACAIGEKTKDYTQRYFAWEAQQT